MDNNHSPAGREQIAEALRLIAAPIFAATLSNTKGQQLTVHVSSVAQQKKVASEIISAVAGLTDGRTKVRFHTPASLMAPRSLEKLVSRFSGDEIVYDPTQSMTRAQSLVLGGAAIRASLGDRLSGLFYAPRLRTLYVSLNSVRLAVGEKVKIGELANIEHSILAALKQVFAGQASECPAIRVGFGVPRIELVPVDQASVTGVAARVLDAARRYWKPAAIAAMLGLGSASTAQARDPAVDGTNVKITGSAGTAADESAWVAGGSLTLPLGNEWGFQADGGVAGFDGNTVIGGGAHLFTRDPDSYLLGLFAAYAQEDQFDLDASIVGAEAEIYLNQVSILAKAGYQFSDSIGDTFVGDVELKWYLSDNFALSGGGNFSEEASFGRAGIEWQPGFSALPGLAFRVDGTVGDDDYESILGGITYYFGADVSLKDRHRRQDPGAEQLLLLMQQLQTTSQQYGTVVTPPSNN